MPKKAKVTSFEGRRVTARGKRALEARSAQVHEDAKVAILLRSSKTSEKVNAALRHLRNLKTPEVKLLNRRRDDVRVFEDASGVERICQREDASLFAVASHSKKRTDNIVLGRIFDGQILDMFEFGVSYVDIEVKGIEKMLGSKPCIVFVGDWDSSDFSKKLRNFFTDFFRGQEVDSINLAGIDSVYLFALESDPRDDTNSKIQITPFRLNFRKNPNNTQIPITKLREAGQPMVLQTRRHHTPSIELFKASLKLPKQLKPKKRKNIQREAEDTIGTIHLGRQEVDDIHTRKFLAHKKQRQNPSADS